jgi:hypothetical protein
MGSSFANPAANLEQRANGQDPLAEWAQKDAALEDADF